VLCIPEAHSQTIRDVDYNPNKLHHVATAGNDRRIKFWDLRKPKLPLKILTGHTHWIHSAKFNRFHDQLLCSGGSDAQVNLWSVLSISSAPLGDLEDYTAEAVKDGDKLIRTYDENEDSVYSVAWSAADAWIFAALSYDGRVVVHHVPPPEKYKILL
jgi:WD40 repeat protein